MTASEARSPTNPRLIVNIASYPLGAGPTCGDTEFRNTANPYDTDPGSPANPLHGVIQVLEVPPNHPAATREIAAPEISYPGDPDALSFTVPCPSDQPRAIAAVLPIDAPAAARSRIVPARACSAPARGRRSVQQSDPHHRGR